MNGERKGRPSATPQGRGPKDGRVAAVTRVLVLVSFATLAPALLPFAGGGGAGSSGGLRGLVRAAPAVLNACGCYQDTTGGCLCGKKARCGCPGQCEPKGCEEKREKQIQKEIDAETKKAQAAGRRQVQAREKGSSRAGRTTAFNEVDRTVAPQGDRKIKARRMTAAQRRELSRLLELYSAERADHATRTIDQVRGELTTSAP